MSEIKVNLGSVGFGIGPVWALQIAFIVLKLCHQINWDWLWVLSPLWISVGLCVGIVALVLLIIFIVVLIAGMIGFVFWFDRYAFGR
jgi:hypothetical protein